MKQIPFNPSSFSDLNRKPQHRSSRKEKRGNRSRKTEAGHLETTSTTKDKEKGNCYNDNHSNSYTNNNRDNNNINHVHSNYCNEEMIRFYWTLSVVEVLFFVRGGKRKLRGGEDTFLLKISRVSYNDRSKNKKTRLNRFKVNQNLRSKDSFATYLLINYYFPKLKWICHFYDEGQCSGPSGLA